MRGSRTSFPWCSVNPTKRWATSLPRGLIDSVSMVDLFPRAL
jgi:hypothetical protein